MSEHFLNLSNFQSHYLSSSLHTHVLCWFLLSWYLSAKQQASSQSTDRHPHNHCFISFYCNDFLSKPEKNAEMGFEVMVVAVVVWYPDKYGKLAK